MQFLKGRCEDDFNQWPLVEMTLAFLRLSMPIQSGLRLIRKCVCGFSSSCLRVGGFASNIFSSGFTLDIHFGLLLLRG
jgi:hypothetical protein